MKINRDKIGLVCEKIIEYSFYCLIFFLPASKSVIEVCATVAFFAWLVKKVSNLEWLKADLKTPPFFNAVLIVSLALLIPLAVAISSALSTRHINLSVDTPLPFHISFIVSLIAVAVLTVFMFSLRSSRHIDSGLKVPFLLFIDITAITAMLTSHHINISLGAFFFKTLEYLLIFFMMAEVINTRKRLVNILIVMCVSSFMVGLDGIYQLIVRSDFLRGFPLYAGKMTASFQFPTNFGCYLTTILPIPIGFIVQGTVDRKTRFCLTALSIMLIVCLLFTRARGAWLGFIVGLFFVCLFSRKKAFFKTLFIVAAFLIILVLFSPTMVKDQFKSFATLSSDTSTEDRIVMWETGWRMFKDRPFLGHGLGTFMNVFSGYKPKNYPWIVYAHNCYLQIIAETGVVGLLIFLWFAFVLIKDTIFKLIKCGDKFLKAFLIGLIGGILAYLVHSFFDTNLYSLPLAVLFWAFAGLAAAKIQFE